MVKRIKNEKDIQNLEFGSQFIIDVDWPNPPFEGEEEANDIQFLAAKKECERLKALVDEHILRQNATPGQENEN